MGGVVSIADANGCKVVVLVARCINCVLAVPGGGFNTCRNADGMGGGEACLAEAVLQDFYVIICRGVILYSLKDVADPIWGVFKCHGGDD